MGEHIDTNQVDPHDPSAGTDPAKECLNTIDNDLPSSAVTSLDAFNSSNVTVSWSGSDAHSGVASYDVYVRGNGGGWAEWLKSTPDTSAVFEGEDGEDVLMLVMPVMLNN